MLIGGYKVESSSSVGFYDIEKDIWTEGPSMVYPRASHDCVTFQGKTDSMQISNYCVF